MRTNASFNGSAFQMATNTQHTHEIERERREKKEVILLTYVYQM